MHEAAPQTNANPTQGRANKMARTLLIPLFLTSGATSLVYEILWERQLHLVVGTSQVSVIIVLAAFMAGLAIGGFIAARIAHRIGNPLFFYAILEGIIGLYALVFPQILQVIQPIYLSAWEFFEPGPVSFAIFQFGLTGLFVLPPTICMGATLPILSRFATSTIAGSGTQVGRLYGANTIGAVLGVAISGFYLLPTMGLEKTTWVTAAANLGLCVAAGLLGAWNQRTHGVVEPVAAPSITDSQTDSESHQQWMQSLYWLAALGGLSSLILEVAWFRLLGLIFGASAYAFSLMLLAFLIGIGTGGWSGGRLADRIWARGGRAAIAKTAARIQVILAIVVYLSMYAYMALPGCFVLIFQWVNGAENHMLLWLANLGLGLLIMLPAAFLMGVMFPLLVKGAANDSSEVGGPVGRIYGWNTVGAILGATIGGLALLPWLHVRGAVLAALCINLFASLIAVTAFHREQSHDQRPPGFLRRKIRWTLGSIFAIQLAAMVDIQDIGGDQSKEFPYWEPLLITAGTYKYVSYIPEEKRNIVDVWNAVWSMSVAQWDMLYYDEGLSTVVTVAKDRRTDNIWLANNGKVDASTIPDLHTQVLVGHVPFIFQPAAEDVLVIGLASGITAGAATTHCNPDANGHCQVGRKGLEIVEIEPTIERASRFFDAANNRPLDDERVTLFFEDGRNHVLRQPDGRYDIIINEPPNPWLSGVANLFTAEFYALGKSKLTPNGVWAQWVQMYGMDQTDLRSLLRTFAETYEHVLLFSNDEESDLILLGSDAPMELSMESIEDMMRRDPAVRADLTRVEIPEAEDLLIRYALDRERILEIAGDAPLNTDDNMRIEYSAPRNLHRSTWQENSELLWSDNRSNNWVPTDVVTIPRIVCIWPGPTSVWKHRRSVPCDETNRFECCSSIGS